MNAVDTIRVALQDGAGPGDARYIYPEAWEAAGKLGETLTEYADHLAWRCHYRKRYGTCHCGLDEAMAELGLEPVAVQDPEAK